MIPVTTIKSRIEAMLDAEGFDHYGFDEDIKPAINYAQDWLTQLYSRLLGQRKFSEEMLRDLSYISVWRTTEKKRISFSGTSAALGDIWTILAVYPDPQVEGSENPPPPVSPTQSYLTDYTYLKSYKSAARTTAEKVNENRLNPFKKGNEVVTGELSSDSYTTFTNVNGLVSEIEIQPVMDNDLSRRLVAIAYLIQPTEIALVTDNVMFPKALLPLLVSKAAQFISTKQGDRTNLYTVTDADIKSLIQLTT